MESVAYRAEWDIARVTRILETIHRLEGLKIDATGALCDDFESFTAFGIF
jgi:hypothetical protein